MTVLQYNTIEQLVELNYRLCAVETPEPERIVELFRRLNAATGRAIYVWRHERGLYRLGAEQILIPRTGQAMDVLTYINASKHYGVYILSEFSPFLDNKPVEKALTTLVSPDNPVHRLMIVVGQYADLPAALDDAAVRIRHSMRQRA